MEPTLPFFIWRNSKLQQIVLLTVSLFSLLFLYLSLELPKRLINEVINGTEQSVFFFSYEIERVQSLLILGGVILILYLVNGTLKYIIGVYSSVVGGRLLSLLRQRLFRQLLRCPPEQFRKTPKKEFVIMLTTGTERFVGVMGEFISAPVYKSGVLVTILVFIFAQDWMLALVAIAAYPLQIYLVPRLQRPVNLLAKKDVMNMRQFSEHLDEVIDTRDEVYASDMLRLKLANHAERLGTIYDTHYQMLVRKRFIEFINDSFVTIPLLSFWLIGGYLAIQEDLSVGALVMSIIAYREIAPPTSGHPLGLLGEFLRDYQRIDYLNVEYSAMIDDMFAFSEVSSEIDELDRNGSGPA